MGISLCLDHEVFLLGILHSLGWDDHIDVLGRRVGVAESNDGDVDVGSLLDSLGIGAWVGDDDEAGLLERAGDVIGEVTGGEATGDSRGTSVSGELEDGTLAVGAGADGGNVGGVVDGYDDAGCQDDLLPLRWELVPPAFTAFSCLCDVRTVLPMLMTLMPSGLVFQTYGSMCTWRFLDPRCACEASSFSMSSVVC
jgi:hypothetical protein